MCEFMPRQIINIYYICAGEDIEVKTALGECLDFELRRQNHFFIIKECIKTNSSNIFYMVYLFQEHLNRLHFLTWIKYKHDSYLNGNI